MLSALLILSNQLSTEDNLNEHAYVTSCNNLPASLVRKQRHFETYTATFELVGSKLALPFGTIQITKIVRPLHNICVDQPLICFVALP